MLGSKIGKVLGLIICLIFRKKKEDFPFLFVKRLYVTKTNIVIYVRLQSGHSKNPLTKL